MNYTSVRRLSAAAAAAVPTRGAVARSSKNVRNAKQEAVGENITCSPVVVDPIYDVVAPGQSFSPIISQGWRTLVRSRLVSSLKNNTAKSQLASTTQVNVGSGSKLAEEALDLFKSLNAAMIGGIVEPISDLCTEPLASCIIRHTEPEIGRVFSKSDAKDFPTRNMRIIGTDVPPVFMQMRISRVSIGKSYKYSFAQACIRVVTEQIPIAPSTSLPKKALTKSSKGNVEVNSSLPPAYARPSRQAQIWRQAISDSGLIYYYNLSTRETTWEKPLEFGVEPLELPEETWTLGSSGKILNRPGKLIQGDGEKKTKVVENMLVLERPLHLPKVGWRIHMF